MSADASAPEAVPWRFKSRGSFYTWFVGTPTSGWRISAANFGADAQAALGLESMPWIALRNEAHAQRVCRRCVRLNLLPLPFLRNAASCFAHATDRIALPELHAPACYCYHSRLWSNSRESNTI